MQRMTGSQYTCSLALSPLRPIELKTLPEGPSLYLNKLEDPMKGGNFLCDSSEILGSEKGGVVVVGEEGLVMSLRLHQQLLPNP